MASRPRIRAYRAGDERKIAELFRACHGRELPLELWRWRYQRNPAGPPVIDVAESGGRIVAHVATIPVRLSKGSAALRAGLWADLMVHPEARGLDLFMRLSESHTRRAKATGIRQLYAFPNDNSYPILKRMLGWKTVQEIDALEAPLERLRLPRPPLPAGWFFEEINEYTLGFNDFWSSVRPAAISIVRDTAWLRWRYLRKPKYNYGRWALWNEQGRLAGWIAAKVFGRIGDVMDLWAEPSGPAAGHLMVQAAEWFRSQKVRRVSAWASRSSRTLARYRAWGFAPIGPRTHFAAIPFNGERWDISKGDSDVF